MKQVSFVDYHIAQTISPPTQLNLSSTPSIGNQLKISYPEKDLKGKADHIATTGSACLKHSS